MRLCMHAKVWIRGIVVKLLSCKIVHQIMPKMHGRRSFQKHCGLYGHHFEHPQGKIPSSSHSVQKPLCQSKLARPPTERRTLPPS
ncbi:unnamed protein product [Prunus armeniaca]